MISYLVYRLAHFPVILQKYSNESSTKHSNSHDCSLYLRCISTSYYRLHFAILITYASQISYILLYRDSLVSLSSFLWTGLLSIPDLSSGSPFLRAASVYSCGFNSFQHPFACLLLMACRFVHVRVWISRIERRREGLLGEVEKWEEERSRREYETCEKMNKKRGKDKRRLVFVEYVVLSKA